MATTIDTLEVEIKSTSQGAADGISRLAVSLGELKKNGTISVAVKNLNNLADSLRKFTTVQSAGHKISALASSMAALKKVGSVKGIATNIEKLGAAMNSVKGLNLDGIDTQFEKIAVAAGKLSGVKSGGLGTMVNALAKIGKVTENLNDEAIDAFANRVQKLNEKLAPLSGKMTTIQAGLKSVTSASNKAASGFGNLKNKVSATSVNLASFITWAQGVVAALQPVIRLLANVIGEAIEWEGIAARFGRGFGEQADEVYSWIQRLNREMGINTQQFMQYSSVFSTMLQGFGVGTEDSAKMALGYTELIYDIWAGYNDVYKNFSDAAEAVKSAIAGEVEPIRRAGFTIVESTLEQTAANHGLEISLANATEAEKSYLRYLTLVDQAHAQNLVGTYARELNTAEGLTRTLAQQVKSLAQAFGSLFLPILVRVIPWIQVLVELLTEAVIALAGFFGIDIQPVDWGGFGSGASAGSSGLEDLSNSADTATGSLGDTADAVNDTTGALKELKNATLGIDELNIISPPESSGGSGGSGSGSGAGAGAGGGGGGGSIFDGLDVDSLWDESIFDQIQSQVDGIKEKLKEWLPVIGIIGGALAGLGIATLLKDMGEALSKMNLLQKLFATVAIVAIEAALVFTFADNYLESGNLLYLIGEALVTAASGYLLFKAWGTKGLVLALVVSIAAQLAAIHLNLADGTIDLSSKELWIQAITTALMGAFGGAIIAKYTSFFAKEGFVIGLGVTISLTMIAINTGAIASGEIDTDSFESWVMQAISVAGSGMTGFTVGKALAGTAAGGKTGLLIGVSVGLVLNLISIVGTKGEDFGDNASDWITTAITAIVSGFTIKKLWDIAGPTIKAAISGIPGKIGAWLAGGGGATLLAKVETALASIPVWGWIAAAVVALIAGAVAIAVTDYDFTDIGEKAGKAIGFVFKYLTPIGLAIEIGKWLINAVQGAIDYFKQFKSFDEFGLALGEGLCSLVDSFNDWYDDFIDAGREIVNGIIEGFKEGWDNLIENLGEFFTGLWNGLCSVFGIASPAKEMKPIGQHILEGIWEGFIGALESVGDWGGELWDTITGWFDGNKTESIDVKVGLVKKDWSSVKSWIGDIPGVSQAVSLAKSGWSTVKRWVGDVPSLSQTVKLAKSGWSSVKSWVGGVPAVSQTVKLAKSGWSSVKRWVGTISTLSQNIKLSKSGWSSVKGWVGSMPSLSAKIKLAKNGWSSVKSWLGGLDFKLKFKLPKIGVNWGSKTVLGFKISYPSSFYTYAKGGFPKLGEMFIAREAGPEMVGKIGSKTTVANNEQIVKGISEGVYAAVMAAMRATESGGSKQSVNVYLDGKQIASSVDKHKHESGASIMGRQVYGY